MREIPTNENAKNLAEIREALLKDGIVKLNHDPYIYGFSKLDWLRTGLKDIPSTIKVISHSLIGYRYPNTIIVERK